MSKINSEQKKVLIDFMEKNHKKLSKKNPSESDRAYKNELWFELAKLLNCYGPPTKTTKLWKRCWVDLKIKTRNKINDMRQNDQIFLSDFEKKLNEICGLKEDAELMSERNGKLLSNKSPERRTLSASKKIRTSSPINTLETLSNHCRICLASNSLQMLNLFNERNTNNNDVSLLDKLNYCSYFTLTIRSDDNLPKFICKSCSILLETAYQFKVLCANSEQKYVGMFDSEAHLCSDNVEIDEFPKLQVFVDSLEEKNILETNIQSKENHKTDNISHVNEKGIELKNECDLLDNIDDHLKFALITVEEDASHKMNNSIHETETITLHCDHCKKTYLSKNALITHMRSHTSDRPYMCEVCGKTFKSPKTANMHRVVHSNEKNFGCTSCSFTTKTKWNLRLHERIHSGVHPYECHICHRKFTTASNIAKHMRNIHQNQRTNKCEKCDRSFFSRETLRKHSIVHSGLKAFYCPVDGCTASYGWYNGLKKHMDKRHKNENVNLPKETFYFSKVKNLMN